MKALKTSLHLQWNGTYVLVTKLGPFEAARDGLRLTTKTHPLDDGTLVPIYDSKSGEYMPAVVINPREIDDATIEYLQEHGLTEAGAATLKEAMQNARRGDAAATVHADA